MFFHPSFFLFFCQHSVKENWSDRLATKIKHFVERNWFFTRTALTKSRLVVGERRYRSRPNHFRPPAYSARPSWPARCLSPQFSTKTQCHIKITVTFDRVVSWGWRKNTNKNQSPNPFSKTYCQKFNLQKYTEKIENGIARARAFLSFFLTSSQCQKRERLGPIYTVNIKPPPPSL